MTAQIIRRPFSLLPDSGLEQISLINTQGNQVNICNMGVNVTDIFITDAHGERRNVILGNDAFDPDKKATLAAPIRMNTLVGRYANRISFSRFTTNNGEFQLPCNLGEHHLHGGDNGLDKQIWQITQAEVIEQVPTLTLQFTSPDGADGYPGEVQFSVQIRFNQDNNLSFDMQANTDQDSYIILTHHGYFNLAGSQAVNMLDHEFKIYSTEVSTADALNIPTGQFHSVANSELDFSEFRLLTDALNSQQDYMHNFLGIDHNYVFKKHNDHTLLKQGS